MMDEAMNESEQYGNMVRASWQLEVLISYRGRDRVRAILGVDDVTLDALLSSSVDWPGEAWGQFQATLDNLRRVGHPVEVDDDVVPGDAERTATDTADETEVGRGGDTDVAGERDSVVPDVVEPEVVSGPDEGPEEDGVEADDIPVPGDGPGKAQLEVDILHVVEEELSLLWLVRDLTIASCLRRRVPYHKQLAGLRVVMMTEAVIIWVYREVPTEPGVLCDTDRQYWESERRRQLDYHVRIELDSVHGGIGGFLGEFLGKGRVYIRGLERRMFAEARKMETGYRPVSLLSIIEPGDFAHAPSLVSRYFSWHHLES